MRSAGTQPRHAVGLYRVSTAEQGSSGLGLEAQQASVRAFAAAQGWTLVAELSDIASGKDDQRPGFQAALTRCRQLGAVLVAARLDRSRERSARPFDGHSIPPKVLRGSLHLGRATRKFGRGPEPVEMMILSAGMRRLSLPISATGRITPLRPLMTRCEPRT